MLSVRQELTFRLLEALIRSGKTNPIALSEDEAWELQLIKDLDKVVDIFLKQTKERWQKDQEIHLGKYLSEMHIAMVDQINMLEEKLTLPTHRELSESKSIPDFLNETCLGILEKSRVIEELSCQIEETDKACQIKVISDALRENGLRLLSLSNKLKRKAIESQEEE